MNIKFGKDKFGKYGGDSDPSDPDVSIFVDGKNIGSIRREKTHGNDYSDWVIDHELSQVIPEEYDSGWSRLNDAKKDVTKALKKLSSKEIKKRAEASMIIESKLVKSSVTDRNIKSFVKDLSRLKFRDDNADFNVVLQMVLHFKNHQNQNQFQSDVETRFLENCVALNSMYKQVSDKIHDKNDSNSINPPEDYLGFLNLSPIGKR